MSIKKTSIYWYIKICRLLPFLPFPSRAPYYTFFIPRLLSPVRRFPLADSRSSPYCPGKIAPPRSETAPKTRPCVDFAPFCLLYSIIFCNMNLLSVRVVTARTDGTGHAEPDVFRRICIMAAGGCDNCSLRREVFCRRIDRFGMCRRLGCRILSISDIPKRRDCGVNGCEFPACPRLSFETGHFFCKLQVCGKKSGYYSGNLRYEKAAAK